MKKLREQADFDVSRNPDRLRPFDKQEFSDRGRADTKVRANDPRFADNPMDDERLDEFAEDDATLDRLHQMLSNLGVTDQQIVAGPLKLTHDGYRKAAARLGVSPDNVKVYLNTLTQNLRDAEDEDEENQLLLGSMGMSGLAEQYYNAVNAIDEEDEDTEAGQPNPPFAQPDRFSYEPDALGSLTVRDATTGRSKFVQGAEASGLLNRLKAPGANRAAILAPIVEKALPDSKPDFWPEIRADAGTYNFMWKLGTQHGSGTVMFHAGHGPNLELVDVRDDDGNEMDVDGAMHRELLDQARDFLGNE
jgi:hypothetical protein